MSIEFTPTSAGLPKIVRNRPQRASKYQAAVDYCLKNPGTTISLEFEEFPESRTAVAALRRLIRESGSHVARIRKIAKAEGGCIVYCQAESCVTE